MDLDLFHVRRIFRTGLVVLACVAFAGCSTLEKKEKADPAPASAKKDDDRNKPAYHEYTDVLIPAELKPDHANSFVYETAGLSAGVSRFTGRVEINSLITFFERNMRKDNWRRISTFKSPRTIMLFQKDNRWCVIQIAEGSFSTEVVVWVAPTLSDLGSGS